MTREDIANSIGKRARIINHNNITNAYRKYIGLEGTILSISSFGYIYKIQLDKIPRPIEFNSRIVEIIELVVPFDSIMKSLDELEIKISEKSYKNKK